MDAANTKYSSQDGILFDKDKTTLIQAPMLIEGTYTVPNTVKTIGESAFTYCTALEGIILPEGLTKIDDTAFMSTNCCNAELIFFFFYQDWVVISLMQRIPR